MVQSTDFSLGQSSPAQISVGTGEHAGVAAVETERIAFEAGSNTSFLNGDFSGTALALDASVYDVALGANVTFASTTGMAIIIQALLQGKPKLAGELLSGRWV